MSESPLHQEGPLVKQFFSPYIEIYTLYNKYNFNLSSYQIQDGFSTFSSMSKMSVKMHCKLRDRPFDIQGGGGGGWYFFEKK